MGEVAGLYWEEHGSPDGPPVVLSPGLGGSADYWAPNLAALAEHYRVILYDHRGTGRSDRTLQPELDVDDMADDLTALLDGLGLDRVRLVGHAAGGVIGLAIALRRPDAAGVAGRRQRLRRGPIRISSAAWRRGSLCSSIAASCRSSAPSRSSFIRPAGLPRHWDRLEAAEAGHIADFQGAANVEARIAALARFDIADRLGEIATPTLLIAAEDDMLVPDLCSEAARTGSAACEA